MFPSFRIVSDGPFIESVNMIAGQTSYAFQSGAVEAPHGASYWEPQDIPLVGQEFAIPEATESEQVEDDLSSES